jgi:hypothetical protein
MWPSSFRHRERKKRTDHSCHRRPQFLRSDHSFMRKIERLGGPGSSPHRPRGTRARFIRVCRFRLSCRHFDNSPHSMSTNANNSLQGPSTLISVWPQYDDYSVQCGADPIVIQLADIWAHGYCILARLWLDRKTYLCISMSKTRQLYNYGFGYKT